MTLRLSTSSVWVLFHLRTFVLSNNPEVSDLRKVVGAEKPLISRVGHLEGQSENVEGSTFWHQRKLADTYFVAQTIDLKIFNSGNVTVNMTVNFVSNNTYPLSRGRVPILTSTNMHCLSSAVNVVDSVGRSLTMNLTKTNGVWTIQFRFSSGQGSLCKTQCSVHLIYNISRTICEQSGGGTKRFYFPWTQNWHVHVTRSIYRIAFPDESMSVKEFVCLHGANFTRKCGKALQLHGASMQGDVHGFLRDGSFQWGLPRTPSGHRACPPTAVSESEVSRLCSVPQSVPTQSQTRIVQSNSSTGAKYVLVFICGVGLLLGATITVRGCCKRKGRRVQKQSNATSVDRESETSGSSTSADTGGGVGIDVPELGVSDGLTSRTLISGGVATSHSLHPCVYSLYWLLLFLAYWFGARRFDYDNDGDIDLYDVEAFMENTSSIRQHFERSIRTGPSTEEVPGQSSPHSLQRTQPAQEIVGKGLCTGDVEISYTDDAGASTLHTNGIKNHEKLSEPRGQSHDVSVQRSRNEHSHEFDCDRELTIPNGSNRHSHEFDCDRELAIPNGSNGHSHDELFGRERNVAGDSHARLVMPNGHDHSSGAPLGGIALGIHADVSGIDQDRYVMQKFTTGQSKPLFIVGQTSLACSLWFVFAIKDILEGSVHPSVAADGLDSIGGGGNFDLRMSKDNEDFCKDLRPQIWRWFTYQFTHVGISHIAGNAFTSLFFGIPLEGLHGSRRMIAMYNIGVFGGACCSLLNDPHSPVVGMSGGCYALIGMQVADLLMNWHNKRFRYPTLILMFGCALVDIIQLKLAVEGVSHAAHFGGYIAGFLIGVVVGKNTEVENWERRLRLLCFIFGILMAGFCLIWSLANWPPRDVWEEVPWCWARQVQNYQRFGTNQWLCVRCGDQSCIDSWSSEAHIGRVSIATCRQQGWAAR